MKKYPIYLNYDPTTAPIGHVEIDDNVVPTNNFPDCVIAPALIQKGNKFELKEFGMIQRIAVDTRMGRRG